MIKNIKKINSTELKRWYKMNEKKNEYCDLCKRKVDLSKSYWKINKHGGKGQSLCIVYFCKNCLE